MKTILVGFVFDSYKFYQQKIRFGLSESYILLLFSHLPVNNQQFIQDFPVVRQAGNLMLSTQLSFTTQPPIETTFMNSNHFQWLQRNFLIPFGLIIGIGMLESFIQQRGKLRE